ncbi:RING zinc finger protein [Blumeria hordei DH14]|uniref:E3 ubiquitin-protein ligase listerin n=1 Tax=Blumeria graminis f. sp. hordei (strain DH14) TaxID=546991 RepID=N1J4Q9_BLUG1|nr:RING zinc finger protein [Blumeria hordei DH14]
MSKGQFKTQASSSRVAISGLEGFGSGAHSSSLSYLTKHIDLSGIDCPHIVVAFKNLSRRDDTTRSKALQDLHFHINAQITEKNEVDVAVIQAWVQIYPQLAIDSHRTVRDFSHTILHDLLRSSRKRMSARAPKFVGSWLAGQFDRDRAVASNVSKKLDLLLQTKEKRVAFYTWHQASALDYIYKALQESPETLSDERSISKEDMLAKYYAVLGSSFSLLIDLLRTLDVAETSKVQESYERILLDKKTWNLVTREDSRLCRLVSELLTICCQKQRHLISSNLDIISRAFIAKALPTPQQGTASAILDALRIVTIEFPEIWEVNHSKRKARKTATKDHLSELKTLMAAGCRMESNNFWISLERLIQVLPHQILPHSLEGAIELLKNIESGISRRNIITRDRNYAWNCYLNTVEILTNCLTNNESKNCLLRAALFPIFHKYFNIFFPSEQSASHQNHQESIAIHADVDVESAVQAYNICLRHIKNESLFADEWKLLSNEFLKIIKTLPESQRENDNPNQSLAVALGELWFSLLAEALKYRESDRDYVNDIDPLFSQSEKIIQEALPIMINNNGEPYQIAKILEISISRSPTMFTSSACGLAIVENIVTTHLPKLLDSASAAFLIKIIFQLPTLRGLEKYFEPTWTKLVDLIIPTTGTSLVTRHLEIAAELIADKVVAPLAQKHQGLQTFIMEQTNYVALGKPCSEPLVIAAFKFEAISESSAIKIRDLMIEYLDSDNDYSGIIFVTELLNNNMHYLMDEKNDKHIDILMRLLSIKEKLTLEHLIDDELFDLVQTLMVRITGESYLNSMSRLILTDLNQKEISLQKISVGYLIDEAKDIIQKNLESGLQSRLLPNTEDWFDSLTEFLDRLPSSAFASSPEFGSISYLIRGESMVKKTTGTPFEDYHLSTMPLRNAIFTTELFQWFCDGLNMDAQINLLKALILTCEVTSLDSYLQNDYLMGSENSQPRSNLVSHFLSQTDSQLHEFSRKALGWPEVQSEVITGENKTKDDCKILNSDELGSHRKIMQRLILGFLETCELRQTESFFAAKALIRVLNTLLKELNCSIDLLEDWISTLDVIKPSTTNIMGAVAILIGLGQRGKSSKAIRNLCNHLVSNVPTMSLNSKETMEKLIFLNACLCVYDGEELPVVQNRLVFAVKHVVSWLKEITDVRIASEVCQLLRRLLPSIKNVYGSYWGATLQFCDSIWTKQKAIPLCNENLVVMSASLKLFSEMKNICDPNDDLIEALDDHDQKNICHLLEFLFLERPATHNPLQEVDKTLAQLIFSIPIEKIEDFNVFYPLLASENYWIQSSAFVLIQKCLPNQQQQISIDYVLENKAVEFPHELLSFIITTPDRLDLNLISELANGFSFKFLASTRSYLLAWLLIFEMYAVSSYKVRSEFNDILQSQKCIGPLMDFIFDTLGQYDDGRIHIKKENLTPMKIRKYDLESSINNNNFQSDLTWILVSLYFQALKYAPSIGKTWWLNTKKQTRNNVCMWTKNLISPLLVEEELDAVTAWAKDQKSLDGEKELIIKVAKKVREVSASYEIDEMVMEIRIRIPEDFPLGLVQIESVSRVGISEQKWNSFIMTTHGIINFSVRSISTPNFEEVLTSVLERFY